jgi:hypothetical protein
MPDFKPCTSLQSVVISGCFELASFEAIECPGLKYLRLWGLRPHQFEGLLSTFKSLYSLLSLRIDAVKGTISYQFESLDERWECFDVCWDPATEDLDFVGPELPPHYLTLLGKLHVELLQQVRLDLNGLIRCNHKNVIS